MIYFWQVLESIHKFTIELHVLQCLFVRASSKKQRRSNIISNFTKGENFHVLYQSSYNLAMWSPFASLLHPSKKGLSFPLSLGGARREYIWKLNWKESLLIYFENFLGAPCPHRQSRNMMMNTFVIVNITPICWLKIV